MLSVVKIKAIITLNLDGYNDKISFFFLDFLVTIIDI